MINTIVTKTKKAKKLIKKALDKHGDKVALSCSFGKDSITLVHLALQVKKDFPIFTVMTKFKPLETFEYMSKMKELWNLNLKVYYSETPIAPNLYKTNPNKCCRILKVKPTEEAVKNLDGWITGLRNTEGRTRKDYKKIEKKGKLIKYNPLLEWTELDIWRYLAINHIPVHHWYKLGYRSLGCAPCTNIVDDSEVEREGRWSGTNKCGGECGIHTKILKK